MSTSAVEFDEGMDQIRKMGDPGLRRVKPEPITVFDADLAEFAKQMQIIMNLANGVGLAANQIGDPRSIFVFDDREGHSGTICNPKMTVATPNNIISRREGCLSIPDQFYDIPRFFAVRVEGQTETGLPVNVTVEGFLARIFQHEVGHLQGKLYIDCLPKEAQRKIRAIHEGAKMGGSVS